MKRDCQSSVRFFGEGVFDPFLPVRCCHSFNFSKIQIRFFVDLVLYWIFSLFNHYSEFGTRQ
jgi:hypothetical protein